MSQTHVTRQEVDKHSNVESCWIIVSGHVYDVTNFLSKHPGNPVSILKNCRNDCTRHMTDFHSKKAHDYLTEARCSHTTRGILYVGKLIINPYQTQRVAMCIIS